MEPVPEFGGLTAEVTPDKPPTITHRVDGWEHYAYKARFAFEQRRLTLDFRTGTAWTEAPTPAQVLESYFDDARSGREAEDFEDFASQYGYEWQEDAAVRRRSERTYKACLKADEQLRTLFGEHFEHAERVFTELGHPGHNSAVSLVMRQSLGDAPEDERQRVMWRMDTVLDGFYDGTLPAEDPGQPVRDLLTDVLHYCEARGINYSEQAAAARRMVTEERHDWGLE